MASQPRQRPNLIVTCNSNQQASDTAKAVAETVRDCDLADVEFLIQGELTEECKRRLANWNPAHRLIVIDGCAKQCSLCQLKRINAPIDQHVYISEKHTDKDPPDLLAGSRLLHQFLDELGNTHN